eukprot:gnl/TRDRNA2_/TRDRNA2_81830_c0_seq2.p1 gnl/TRDRNA2_/TRDRNA2_81830_c0~~gnl/TRDRNA2_/TRDRNA2_81830_c0_seq2.p1  ORF type:complete len:252 (+),score=44.74 gnl/TRDRNA2_/TRDRNA2_81830_c0_seq2:47-802(+)
MCQCGRGMRRWHGVAVLLKLLLLVAAQGNPMLWLGQQFLRNGPGEHFRVKFEVVTRAGYGSFNGTVMKRWAPIAYDHFRELLEAKYYDDTRIFRVTGGEHGVIQFGLNGDPKVTAEWKAKPIKDEVKTTDKLNNPGHHAGIMCFYKSAKKNSRTTQVFINMGENWHFDDLFTPFMWLEGMEWSRLAGFMKDVGENATISRIEKEGNRYLDSHFPDLPKLIRIRIIPNLVTPEGEVLEGATIPSHPFIKSEL